MNLEQIVKETVAKIVAEKKGKDLTGDGKIDSADYLKARDIAIKKAQGKEMDEARFKKGEDVGGKGFEFKDIAKKAAKQYGSKEAGQRVAGAILKKVLNKEGEDHEVAMAQSSLESIIRSAMELKAKIGNQEIDIPAWIQDHITNSENYIEQASQGYHEYENGGHEEMNEEYDFVKSAIESASGDKISHTEEDDYGRTIYWSAKNPNVNYFVGQGGEFEGKIYLYNGETGERYPIGDLKHYGDGQNHSADDDMHEAFQPKTSFDDYTIGDTATLAGKKVKILNMKMDDESGERRARVRFEDGSVKEVNINTLDENKMNESRVPQDNVADHLADALEYVWNMGKGNNSIDFQDFAQSLYFDIFGGDEMNESQELDENKMDKEELKQAQIEKAYDQLEKMKANTRLFSKEDIKKAEERIEKLEAELDALAAKSVNESFDEATIRRWQHYAGIK